MGFQLKSLAEDVVRAGLSVWDAVAIGLIATVVLGRAPLDTSAGGMGSYADGDVTVGYARTPGYETYQGLGWYGCLVQRPAGEAMQIAAA